MVLESMLPGINTLPIYILERTFQDMEHTRADS